MFNILHFADGRNQIDWKYCSNNFVHRDIKGLYWSPIFTEHYNNSILLLIKQHLILFGELSTLQIAIESQ